MKILLLFLLALTAEAAPLSRWQAATVQVSSFPCLTERPRFSGSGLLVSLQQKVYVLTSEHVVIQSAAICQEVSGLKAELVAADYLKGLALLRVLEPTAEMVAAAVPHEELSGTAGSSLAALGFPSGSDQLQVLREGKTVNATSRRALIAGVPEMIEASGLPVEYGMSGGVLVSGEGNYSFAGILSHQVLRREAGRPTSPGEVKPGEAGNASDLTLAIPAAIAREWISGAVKGQEEWRRDPDSQIEGKEAVVFGPLVFSLKQKSAKDVWDVGGADGTGIGGADGTGIGGEGKGSALDPEQLLTVEITLNPAADKSRVMSDSNLEQWRGWLLAGRKVEAVFLRNANAKRLQKIGSLAQFFTFWMRDKMIPLAVRSKVGEQKADSEVLIKLASGVAGLAQQARDSLEGAELKAWFTLLRDSSLLAQNGLISSKELLGTLEGQNDIYWRQFYDRDFQGAVALESAIQDLAQQMKKMGL